MIRFKPSVGRTVVSLDEGAIVGKLDDFQFDLESRRIYGYRIKGARMFGKSGGIRADRLLRVGKDVAFVQGAEDVELGAGRTAVDGRSWASQYRGTRVMTRNGQLVGTVDDLVYDAAGDTVIALVISQDRGVVLDRGVATGPAACILDSETRLHPLTDAFWDLLTPGEE